MTYIPAQGDIVYLDFGPQTNRKPALIISNNTFNQFTKTVIACPITNIKTGYPLHVELDEQTETAGVIMCEQVKALDVRARNAAFHEKAPKNLVDEVIDIIISFVETED